MAANFTLDTLELTAPAIARLTFSQMPLAASTVGEHDSTNKLNYSVVGPSDVQIALVRPVKGNPFAVEVVGTAAFDVGQWVFSFQNIETPLGQALETTQLSLEVDSLQKFFNAGVKNSTGEDIIRQHLNPIFDGPGWAAYVASCGYSDQKITDLAKAAFFQNFMTTASDVYLEKLTTAISVDRAPNTGMSDDTLRQLAIAVNANKVVVYPYLEVLQAYYGRESVVANIKAGVNEPFDLDADDTLLINVDGYEIVVVFDADDFSNIGEATALEVAQVLNRAFLNAGSRAYADVVLDPTTGTKTVQIFSGHLGLSGSILVHGGTAEKTLQLPKIITTDATTGVAWTIMTHTSHPTLVPYGRAWLRFAGGTPNPAINNVYDGDYVLLHDSAFSADNRGDFHIIKVGIYLGTKYLEFANTLATAESVSQATDDGLIFLDDSKTTINGTYFASAIQPWSDQVDVLLPATASAINRTEKTGAYLNGEAAVELDPYEAFRLEDGTVYIGFPSDHSLIAGQFVQLQNFEPIYDRDPFQSLSFNTDISTSSDFILTSAVELEDGKVLVRRRFDWAIFDPETNMWSENTDMSLADRSGYGGVLLENGQVLIVGGVGSPTTAEIYDQEADAIAPTASPNFTHTLLPSVGLLPNGKAFAFGGGVSDAVELYNSLDSSWTTIATSTTGAHVYQSAVVTKGGQIVCLGGCPTIATVPQYASAVRNVTALDENQQKNYTNLLPAGRFAGCALFVPKGPRGQVWYFGGYDTTSTAVDTVYVIDLATMTVVNTYTLNYPRAFGQILPLSNGKYVLFGGSTLDPSLVFAAYSAGPPPEIIDPMALSETMKFRTLAPELTLNYEIPSAAIALGDGRMLVTSPLNPIYHTINIMQQTADGGMSGKFKILTAPTTDSITIETPQHQWRTNWLAGQVVPVDATRGELQSGYLINPTDGVTITGTTTTLSQQIISGAAPASILVSSVVDIPDASGYLVFSFGTRFQSRPIRYLGVTSGQIRLDPSGIFEYTYLSGTEITLLASKGVYSPASTLNLGVFYATASSAGRIAASDDIDSIAAIGLTINKTILYPGDRGLAGQRLPAEGAQKLSDKVAVWGGDSITTELEAAREGDGGA